MQQQSSQQTQPLITTHEEEDHHVQREAITANPEKPKRDETLYDTFFIFQLIINKYIGQKLQPQYITQTEHSLLFFRITQVGQICYLVCYTLLSVIRQGKWYIRAHPRTYGLLYDFLVALFTISNVAVLVWCFVLLAYRKTIVIPSETDSTTRLLILVICLSLVAIVLHKFHCYGFGIMDKKEMEAEYDFHMKTFFDLYPYNVIQKRGKQNVTTTTSWESFSYYSRLTWVILMKYPQEYADKVLVFSPIFNIGLSYLLSTKNLAQSLSPTLSKGARKWYTSALHILYEYTSVYILFYTCFVVQQFLLPRETSPVDHTAAVTISSPSEKPSSIQEWWRSFLSTVITKWSLLYRFLQTNFFPYFQIFFLLVLLIFVVYNLGIFLLCSVFTVYSLTSIVLVPDSSTQTTLFFLAFCSFLQFVMYGLYWWISVRSSLRRLHKESTASSPIITSSPSFSE